VRIALLTAGAVPNPSTGGAALTTFTLLSYLAAEGHDVVSLAISDPEFVDAQGVSAERRVEALRERGIEVRPIVSRADEVRRALPGGRSGLLRRAWRPSDGELFPHLVDAPAVRDVVEELRPDAVLAFHWEALAASTALRGVVPRFAGGVDLPHLPSLYRLRVERTRLDKLTVSRLLLLQAQVRHQPRLLVRMLQEVERAVDFAAHHAAWLRRRGVRCEYFRLPIADFGGPAWEAERDEATRADGPPRVAMLGHMQGTVTLDALRVLSRLLPYLERELGRDGFRIDVLGGHDPPAHLAVVLEHPAIRRHGHVPSVDEWLRRAAVVLVPTSIPLGVRVRILTSFSLGACVVAHAASAFGTPELAHGENVLLGRAPDELAGAIVSALRDGDLRRGLGAAGRRTYERYFAPQVAGARVAAALEAIV
jgi:glycosyltransferase involved in cell wall biosynthesis